MANTIFKYGEANYTHMLCLFPKLSSDHYTNALVCYGFAKVLKQSQVDPLSPIEIADAGTHYEFITHSPLLPKSAFTLDTYFDLPVTGKEKAELSADLQSNPRLINLEEEKAKKTRYEEDSSSLSPNPRYNHYWGVKIINKSATSVKITEGVQRHKDTVIDTLYTYVEACATRSITDIKAMLQADPLKKLFGAGTPSQVTDPIRCKGTSGLYSSEGNANVQNWFVEWLKWIGVMNYASSLSYQNGQTKITALYTVLPQKIPLHHIEKIFEEILTNKRVIKSDGLKRDVLVYNTVITTLITLHEKYAEAYDAFSGERIDKACEGLIYTTYMNMGNAYSPIHQHIYKIPSFIQLTDRNACEQWIDAYENLSKVIASCDVKKDSMELVTKYKDFIASEQVNDFLEFIAIHSVQRFHSFKEKYRVYPFYSPTLSLFITNMVTDMKEIITNQGFLAIAKAIKNATINGQYAKGRGQIWNWEIHYTLPTDLQRSVRNKEDFVAKLTNFINAYNRENAKLAEHHKDAKRKSVSADDLAQMMTLVDKYAPKTLCNLLLAYGSASTPKIEATPSGSPALSGDETEGDTEDGM